MTKKDSFRYLGVPIGLLYDANDMNTITEKLSKDHERICHSLLINTMVKLDSIRTLFSCV